ncbi:MAG: response regulator [Anaerolineae bacterium]
MSHKNDIRKLIGNLQRRLQKLKEQQALMGLGTPPHILIEIEDIKVEIENLQTELEKLGEGSLAPVFSSKKPTILFVDNNRDFLKTRSEFLEQGGYDLILAFEPKEALKIMAQEQIDLVILDLRLINDDDEKDFSGLNLAKESNPSIPKIILTRFPSVEAVREALRPAFNDLPPALDFISKLEGPEALLTAVKRALMLANSSKKANKEM